MNAGACRRETPPPFPFAPSVHTDDDQQPMNTATPIVEPQQADAEVPPIAENTKRTPKASGLRKVAIIGRVLMWGGVATTVLASSH